MYEAYALGALDAAELAAFEAHLATGCAECAKGVAEARWIVSQLAYVAPDAGPSDMLKGRLMQTVRAEAKSRGGSGGAVSGGGTPVATMAKSSAIPLWMWAGVAALLLVALYFGWNSHRLQEELTAEQSTIEQLQQSNTEARQKLAAVQERLVATESENAILGDPAAKKIVLAAQKIEAPQLMALWEKQKGIVLAGQHVPMPSRNRVLQLWLIPKDPAGKPIPSITVRPDANGRMVALVAHPPDPSLVKALAITEEPEGGSPQPTSAVRWVGAMT
jgi:anti-sigma-K factor RskA